MSSIKHYTKYLFDLKWIILSKVEENKSSVITNMLELLKKRLREK